MSETTDKINKLVIQHKVEENENLKQQLEIDKNQINYFIEENERLKEELASFMNGDYCAEGCKKMNNAFRDAHKGILEENEKLKAYIKDLQTRKDRYYLQVLEYERQVSDWISFYIKVRDIVSGNYEILDSQGLQDLRRIVNNIIVDQKESEER